MKNFIVILLSSFVVVTAQAQREDLDAKNKGLDPGNTGKMVSMVIEPSGNNQLKIFLTGKQAADFRVEDATVEASYYVGKERRTLAVKRQTDAKTKRPYFVIDKVDPKMKNLKLDVKSGKHSESFDLPDLN